MTRRRTKVSQMTNPLLRSLLKGVSSISRRTWVIVTASVLVLLGLLIWVAITAATWLFGIAQQGADAAPATVRSVSAQVEQFLPGFQETVRSATAQVEQIIPGAQETVGALLPTLTADTPARDVSGTDPGPVARFPGLTRIEWQRAEQHIDVRYQGRAGLAEVIAHYTSGFAAQGYEQNLLSATSSEERHEFVKGGERFSLTFSLQEGDLVTVDLRVSSA